MKTSKGKFICIIQARMSATRLPGKVLINLGDKTVLEHVVERLRLSKGIDACVVATTNNPLDDQIVDLCQRKNIAYCRGSEQDVLGRYYEAAQPYPGCQFIRVTADCPLIDPHVTDLMIASYMDGDFTLVTNVHIDQTQRTFPRGLDIEIFTFEALEEAYRKAEAVYEREHVTPYIYEHSERVLYFKNSVNYSRYRWTLDTPEDLALIEAIYAELYHGKHDFFMRDVVALLERRPELNELNKEIIQKPIKG